MILIINAFFHRCRLYFAVISIDFMTKWVIYKSSDLYIIFSQNWETGLSLIHIDVYKRQLLR